MTLLVAALVFWLAFDGGAYELESRNSLSIVVWWTIIMAVGLGLWPLAAVTTAALAVGGLLAGYAAITAASIAWSASAEKSFTEFNRVTLYLGVFTLAVLAGTRGNAAHWSDGLGIGITATGVFALASRLFPAIFPEGEIAAFLPSAYARLSYPLNYWNGLAIFIALAFPPLLRLAATTENAFVRGLSVAPFPALVAAVYLTSSRGGFAVALIGTLAFVVLTERRWLAATAVSSAAAGSAVAIVYLASRPALVNRPLEPAAEAQGPGAAVVILLACAVTGVTYAVASRYVGGRIDIGRRASRAAVGVVAVAAIIGIAAADPIQRFESFKRPPTGVAHAEDDFVRAHLASWSGSGRWQFWQTAIDEFEHAPLLGGGAGSYEAWWAREGTLDRFIRDAHSLYLEALAELGIVGFMLLVSAFVVGLAAGARRVLKSEGDERVTAAALFSAFLAFAFAAGIDWMWELTVVSVVGVTCLGLVTGPATANTPRIRPARTKPGGHARRRVGVGAAALALAWLLICAQAIPLLAQVRIGHSQDAAARGDAAAAVLAADDARNLQPWASSPYLQLALLAEEQGELDLAREWVREAIERDSEDWRLWLVAARIETKAGAIPAARRSVARAAALNPRSPIFADLRP